MAYSGFSAGSFNRPLILHNNAIHATIWLVGQLLCWVPIYLLMASFNPLYVVFALLLAIVLAKMAVNIFFRDDVNSANSIFQAVERRLQMQTNDKKNGDSE